MKNPLFFTGLSNIFGRRTDVFSLVFQWFFIGILFGNNTLLPAQSGCNCEDFILINGGFEEPAVPAGSLAYLNGNTYPGWETTDVQNVIEIWGSGFLSVPSYEGTNFAEINAFSFGTLFQDVLTCPGETYYWQVAHRGRQGEDVATFELGPPNGPFTVVQTMTDGNTAWGFYSGAYVVPAGQTVTRIRLTAVTAAGGPTVGNFVDDFAFKPTFCTTDTIICPESITVDVTAGAGSAFVNYDQPFTFSTCANPDVTLTLSSGLPSGSNFPVGITQVCYTASDSCNNVDTCCFTVTVKSPEQPCDVKTIGCMKYELLSITQDATAKKTYRIRVTNNCNNPLTYTAIQLPNSMTAKKPLNNTIYTAPGGRQYLVRNPNYAPFWSIRFKSTTDSISGGESDIFEYTLPAQAQPAFIHITSRLEPQVYYEAHLNTFYCPVGVTPVNKGEASVDRDFTLLETSSNLHVFPNPTAGLLYADLSAWAGEQVRIQVFNGQGQRVQRHKIQAGDTPQEILLPETMANGVYLLEILGENGEKQTARFVINR